MEGAWAAAGPLVAASGFGHGCRMSTSSVIVAPGAPKVEWAIAGRGVAPGGHASGMPLASSSLSTWEIDEVVAGQLSVQICEHDPDDDRYVTKRNVDRVCGESVLGVGDLARRRAR